MPSSMHIKGQYSDVAMTYWLLIILSQTLINLAILAIMNFSSAKHFPCQSIYFLAASGTFQPWNLCRLVNCARSARFSPSRALFWCKTRHHIVSHSFSSCFFFPQKYLNTEIPASYPSTTLKTAMLSLHTLQMAWELLCETECLYHMLDTLDGLQNSYSIAGAEYSTPV